jgi:acetylornithine deacetylase
MTVIAIDRNTLLKHLVDLVQIDSVNSDLEPGAAGEGEIADYLAQAMREIGLEVHVHEVEAGRSNVVGILKGTGGGKSLMLNAHTDTVGVTGMAAPFAGEIHDGKVYGRGAFDMKGSIAACLSVMQGFISTGVQPAGDVLFTAVIDEEYGSKGTDDIVRHYTADAAIVTEPTGLRVCRAHRGFVWIEIETIGRAAHGSRYMDGIDANMLMGRVLVGLEQLSQALLQREPHPLLGPPSIHAPLIKGGTSQSVYAARCRIELERRTLPGETPEAVIAEVQAVVDALAAADPNFKAAVRLIFQRPAFEVSAESAIAQAVQKAAHTVLNATPETYGELWWMDSALLAEAGIETIIIGPSGAGAHADEEWVDVESVDDLAQILAKTVVDFCSPTDYVDTRL